MQQPWQSYTNTMSERIATAKPEQLMAMLYEGVIMRVKQAQERFASAQPTRAKESLVRAMRIVDALMDHVNLEAGGETAQNLERLLFFVINQLSEATRSNDPRLPMENALRVILPLCQSWQTLATRVTEARP